MEVTKITLEDRGQDFLELYVNDKGVVIDAKPFLYPTWAGAYIPVSDKSMMRVGEPCPIHHPPHIVFGFLRYNIEKIERVEYND